MNAIRGLAFAIASTLLVLLAMTTVQAEPTPASYGVDWVNGRTTVTKISDHKRQDGDQYIYGNIPRQKLKAIEFYRVTNVWSPYTIKGNPEYRVVPGETTYKGADRVVPFGSARWHLLDFKGYGNPSVYHSPATDGIALVNYANQDYGNNPSELYYDDNILDLFGSLSLSRDGANNIVRATSRPFKHKLTYPDGRALSIRDNRGITFSSNGKWLYVNAKGIGQLRIDTDTFSVFSFEEAYDPYYSIKSAVSNDGRFVVRNSADNTRIYDLEKCSPEKPNYGPRNCAYRDLTNILKDGVRQVLPGQGDLTHISLMDIKFMSNSSLKLLVDYRYGTENGKRAFIKLDTDAIEPPERYLALGDSFSSGEGIFEYTGPTDFYKNPQHFNVCHVSPKSYPYLLAKSTGQNWFNSVACSGSVVDDVISPHNDDKFLESHSRAKTPDSNKLGMVEYYTSSLIPGYVPQITTVKKFSPTVATITIGGNDIGFKNIAIDCITQPACYIRRDSREKKADEIASKILGMSSKLRAVRDSMAGSNPKLYVLGYPKIVSTNGLLCSLMSFDARERLDALTDYLNESIKISAQNAGAIYIDLSSAFVESIDEDHRLCGNKKAAVNGYAPPFLTAKEVSLGFDLVAGAESYHPNKLGHKLMADKVYSLTNGFKFSPINTSPRQVKPADSFYSRFVGDNEDKVEVLAQHTQMTDQVSVQRGSQIDLKFSSPTSLASKNGKASLQLWSDPVDLGTIDFNPSTETQVTVTIPENIEPGYHQLHLLYTDVESKEMDLYQYIYVMASLDDYDGDGIRNEDEACAIGNTLGIDSNNNGIDDACDPYLGNDIAPPSSGEGTKESAPSSTSSKINRPPLDTAIPESRTDILQTWRQPPGLPPNLADNIKGGLRQPEKATNPDTDNNDIPSSKTEWNWAIYSTLALVVVSIIYALARHRKKA